jgi:hypothetical protein
MRTMPSGRYAPGWNRSRRSGALRTPASLQTRVGVATGLVEVGDLIGSGSAQEQAIVGETPNLAARLQGIAEPNMVIIAESTRRLLDNLFELEDLGAKDLKGSAGPVRAWVALRSSTTESRFEAVSRERSDCSRRARRRNRTAVAALVASKEWRGPGSTALRRSRNRQASVPNCLWKTATRTPQWEPKPSLFDQDQCG